MRERDRIVHRLAAPSLGGADRLAAVARCLVTTGLIAAASAWVAEGRALAAASPGDPADRASERPPLLHHAPEESPFGLGDPPGRPEPEPPAEPGPPAPPEPPPSPHPPAGPPPVCRGTPALSAGEVAALLEAATGALRAPLTAAVVDRTGRVLGVVRKPGAPPADADRAVGLARTGAFFSNDQAPLSSRTVRFVSGIHFPPGIARTPNAALYGIEHSNRGCELDLPPGSIVPPPAGSLAGGRCDGRVAAGCGTGPVTGKRDRFDSDPTAVDAGGVPVFRGASLVGGLGVVVAGAPPPGHAEFAALAAIGGAGLAPAPTPLPGPGVVVIDGIRLPFVEQTERPAGTAPDPAPAGLQVVPPAPGGCAPDGFLVTPRAGSFLTASEVEAVVERAVARAERTRAVIRLPPSSPARMVIAVGDVDGSILALLRMPDATFFSVDVAVAKARNVAWWSSPAGKADLPGVPAATAVTNRTLSFGAQPLFPAGIDGTDPGPFFDLLPRPGDNPCRQGTQAPGPRQNGIVFFPGSVPLYRGRLPVGGLGVSGDGVEQDDYVSFFGAGPLLPPEDLWADRVFVRGVRLPFLKFPRQPER